MNEYGFDFDFEVDNESTMMGKGMWLLINVLALTFSAMTTGAFFYTYVGDAFAFLFGAWSPYVTAFAGMTALDGLSRAWAMYAATGAIPPTRWPSPASCHGPI